MKELPHIVQLNTNREWGGGEHQVLSLVAGLSHKGVRTTLFTYPRGGLFRQSQQMHSPVEVLPLRSPHRHLIRLLRNRTALLHVHDSKAAAIGIRVAKELGIPLVLSRRVASPLRRNPYSRWKYSARNIAAVIAISETVKTVFAQSGYPEGRIHVVPSGLDIDALDRMEKNNRLRERYGESHLLGGIGKLSVKKNWQLMIRVAAKLAAEGTDLQWVLVGDGSERRRLERLVTMLDVSRRVHFLGFRADAVHILKSLDLLFFPSRMEGASVTVRQAMILGVPVVAADAPGTVESLAGNGWFVKWDDVEGAAAVVRHVLAHTKEREAMCRRARESALARFSIERTVQGTMRVYERVIDECVS